MQCRVNGFVINDAPKICVHNPDDSTHSNEVVDPLDLDATLHIPLFFCVRKPSTAEFEDDNITKLDMMYESPEWDPCDLQIAVGHLITLFVSPRGSLHKRTSTCRKSRSYTYHSPHATLSWWHIDPFWVIHSYKINVYSICFVYSPLNSFVHILCRAISLWGLTSYHTIPLNFLCVSSISQSAVDIGRHGKVGITIIRITSLDFLPFPYLP